ncbi:MAG: hypothetical protein HY812_21945 [Planctomycetes bacterium]|nr:hypothetical protein [Planctomycetota bacterium]
MVPVLCQSATNATALGQAPQWLGLALVFVWLVLLILKMPVERLVFKAVGVLSFTLLLSVALGYFGEGGEFGDWTVRGAAALSCSTLVVFLLALGLPASFALATDWGFYPAILRHRAARALAAEPMVGTIGRYQVRGGYAHDGLGGAAVVEPAEDAAAEQAVAVQDAPAAVEPEAPPEHEEARESAPVAAEEHPWTVDPPLVAEPAAEQQAPPEPAMPDPIDVMSFLVEEPAALEPAREAEPALERDATLDPVPEPERAAPVEEAAPWWARRREGRHAEPADERAEEVRAEPNALAEEDESAAETVVVAPPVDAMIETPVAEAAVEAPAVETPAVETPSAAPVAETEAAAPLVEEQKAAAEEPAEPAAEPPAAEAAPEASRETASAAPPPRTLGTEDQLFVLAGDCVVKAERASISFLQKSLGVGYFQAAKLLDRLEREGVIGPYTGAVNRDVLMNAARWQERRPV